MRTANKAAVEILLRSISKEIGDAVAFLAFEKVHWITGLIIQPNGGMVQIGPNVRY